MQQSVFIRLVAGSILAVILILSGPFRKSSSNVTSQELKPSSNVTFKELKPSSNMTSKELRIDQKGDPKQTNATIWADISNKLCPDMVPQSTKYARHLFHLAQQEILKGNVSQTTPTDCSSLKRVRKPKTRPLPEFAVLFFEFPKFHWRISSHLDPGKRQFFSYLSIWKCANMKIRAYEEKIFNGTKVIKFPSRHIKSTKTAPISDCIVAAIRDPISHFVSGYNEIEYRAVMELNATREAVAREWPFGQLEPGSTERFEQFVADLVTCPIGKQRPGIEVDFSIDLELAHIYSMSAILRLLDKDPHIPNDNKNFHYLPTLANLNETWAPFVLASCPAAFSEHTKAKFLSTEMESQDIHISSKDPVGTYKAAKTVVKKGGPAAKALCAIHLMDYACWQDLPDGVPKVCMDLYLDYHRRDLLL